MVIDSISGIIQWTPSDSGSYSVTVNASNNFGTPAIQSFEIHVTDLTNCPDNIISYWKLNEISGSTYKDLYNTHDAEAGTNAPTPVVGKVNSGQQFDGFNDEINIPPSNDFDFGASDNFAIEFWIKRPGSTLKRDANVVIGRTDGNTLMRWWVGLNNEGKATFQLRSKTGETHSVIGTSALNDSNWHHIAAVRDANSNQLKIYADGKLEGTSSATYTSGFDSPTANITVGWLSIGLEQTFYGVIDELAIYSNVLEASLVERHYAGGISDKDYCDHFVLTSVQLLLEGAYDTTSNQMSTIINWIIPTTSPYLEDARTVDSIPSNVVDWVLVELRSSVNGTPEVSKSVFLNKTGNLVADDGVTPYLTFDVPYGNYRIVIKHRNSIEIWSNGIQTFNMQSVNFNFTLDSSKTYGSNVTKKGTRFCIYSGDINQDGIIDIEDLTIADDDKLNNTTGYANTDVNLDGIVDNGDILTVSVNSSNYIMKAIPQDDKKKNKIK